MGFTVLSGKEPAGQVLEEIGQKVKKLRRRPLLGIIVIGEYKPSQIYVKRKIETAASTGIETAVHKLPDSVSEKELLILIDGLNKDENVDGFIVQTPLPKHISADRIIEAINPLKDVDGFHPHNLGKLFVNDMTGMFPPATPFGVIRMLEYYNVPLEGKNTVVIGRSNNVGKPMAILLLHKNTTVTVCHSKTRDLAGHTANADIIIAAAGSPGLLKADMVKEGAYVIDVGTTRIKDKDGNERVVGDVDFENVIKRAHCSPVPGGVGPMTVAMLLENTVNAAERRMRK